MQNKNKRILWLLNHTTLREFEVPLLVSLGFEVYTPKRFPVDEENLSASVTYDYDTTLSIPQSVLNILDAHDFYQDPLPPQIARLINAYFGIAFFAFFPVLMQELVRHFRGSLFLRIFGLSANLSYTKLITQTFNKNFWNELNALKKRFWFAQAYDHLIEVEGDLLKYRGLSLPLGLPNIYFQHQNSWIGDKNELLFICPRIESSATYYGEIYKKFKQHFSHLPHIIAGNQPIAVNDSSVKGFQSREQFNQWLIHCKVMFYHSQEPRHLHYHPLEAILFGMPLVYMRGGILEKPGGIKQPGACTTFKEAREKIEKILNNDSQLIQTILKEQSKLLDSFKFDSIQAIWKKNFVEKIIHSSPKATTKPPTIGVFLPIGYLGGSLRGAKNIAKMLKLGSEAAGTPVKVVFSYVSETYDVSTEFSDLLKMGISIRETQWKTISGREFDIANSFEGIPLQDEKKSYLLPCDGVCNF